MLLNIHWYTQCLSIISLSWNGECSMGTGNGNVCVYVHNGNHYIYVYIYLRNWNIFLPISDNILHILHRLSKVSLKSDKSNSKKCFKYLHTYNYKYCHFYCLILLPNLLPKKVYKHEICTEELHLQEVLSKSFIIKLLLNNIKCWNF